MPVLPHESALFNKMILDQAAEQQQQQREKRRQTFDSVEENMRGTPWIKDSDLEIEGINSG
jgi:hypothetical protein